MKRLKDYILEADDDLGLDLGGDDGGGDDLGGGGDDLGGGDGDGGGGSAGDTKTDPAKKPSSIKRGDIKFTIWKSPDEKTTDLDSLNDNKSYQKIEYKLIEKKEGLSIDFLLGYQEDSWKLWIGKIGSCSYDDDPYKSFNTDKFRTAIVMSLDTIEEFIDKIKKDPDDYVQFYVHR